MNYSKAVIKHGGNDAFYNPVKDFIKLPKQEQFESATQYYAVKLHEWGHWTGHQDRLNREMMNKFGTPDYAREELRAEIGSLMMGSELNIGHYFGQHAAYVNDWISVLKNDPYELHRAASDAQKIFDLMLDIEQKRELKLETAPKNQKAGLEKDEVITYNNTEYKMLAFLKHKVLQMEDLGTGNKFKLSMNDGLYTSLVQAKHNPVQLEQQETAPEQAMVAEEATTYRRTR